MLKRNPVYEALRKGKYFELTYEGLFDDKTRVVAMTNLINLIKATNGKNLILSSHASEPQRHRTPYDAAALLSALGLPKNLALGTMKENPRDLLSSAVHRKFFKGAITQIPETIVVKLNKRIQKHRLRIKQLSKDRQE